MNKKVLDMLQIYAEVVEQEVRQKGRREGRQEGVLTTQVRTIEGLLGREVPWSTIEGATGIDQTTFRRLKQQLAAADTDDHSTE